MTGLERIRAATNSPRPSPPLHEAWPHLQARTSHSGGTGKKRATPQKADLDRRLAFFALTDLGNAERFYERMKDRFKWVPATGGMRKAGWLYWDGRRWSSSGADEQVKLAEHETVRAIQAEAEAIRDTDKDFVVETKKSGEVVLYSQKLSAHGRASEAAPRLAVISKRATPKLFIEPEQLDSNPMLINVLNGTLIVAKTTDGSPYITFRDHSPSDLCTRLMPVNYDPDATCPEYDACLEMVQPKPENRRFLHQWGGVSLTGNTSDQALSFWWGKGKNGKSTVANIWAYVYGDYGASVPIETFLNAKFQKQGGQATPDLAMLRGVRALRTSEPERGSRLGEALIKLATGSEPMPVRHLNNDYFFLTAEFKLTMSGNYRPQIHGTDEGIWRRVKLLPWTVTVPEDKRVKDFDKTLRHEASGILNRLLDGLCDWLDNGLVEPEDVIVATAEYRRDSDTLGQFLSVCVADWIGERIQSSELHKVFVAWAKATGNSEWSNKGLSNAMSERGYARKHSDAMWWLDIKLIKQASDFIDPMTGDVRTHWSGPDPPSTFPSSHYRED